MVFSYRILRTKDGHLMAEGMTQNVFTHKETGKVARLADEPYNKLKALYELDLFNNSTLQFLYLKKRSLVS